MGRHLFSTSFSWERSSPPLGKFHSLHSCYNSHLPHQGPSCSLPQQKGEKRWIQIKLHVPSVARMLPLFTREKGNLQFCNVKVFQNILFTSKAAAISITPRYNILCTQRFSCHTQKFSP